ncbi:MAG: accessory factor UbiK family protein [Alphaproteobacteria bacterium]|tara:strand:- start:1442 stop:1711 length:270 start_codon:yes stop_codon:yes gene_type:complete
MSKKEFIKEDIVKLLGGASSALGILKDEVEERIKDRVEKVILKLDLINKKDFLVVKKMAEEARIQNDKLSKKINLLENKITLINKKFKK